MWGCVGSRKRKTKFQKKSREQSRVVQGESRVEKQNGKTRSSEQDWG